MAEPRNIPPALVRTFQAAKAKGQVKFGADYLQKFRVNATYFEVAIPNGFNAGKPPFGFVYQVNPINANNAILRVFDLGDFEDVVTAVDDVQGAPWICSATITREIVNLDTAVALTGSPIWSSTITQIDEIHGERTTIRVVSKKALESEVWSSPFGTYVIRTTTLRHDDVEPIGDSDLTLTGYVHYEDLKCGWNLKHVDNIPVTTSEQKTQWGIGESQKTPVDPGTATDHAEGVEQSRVDQIGNALAQKYVVNFPTPSLEGIIGELQSEQEDPVHGFKVITRTELVINSKAAAILAARQSAGYVVTLKEQDQHHAIIESSIVDDGFEESGNGQSIEVRPYATITTNRTYSDSDAISTSQGSSRVIYKHGEKIFYEVSEITSSPRATLAGLSKDERGFVTLDTVTGYSTSPTISGHTGSSRVVINDGDTIVYEVTNTTATANARSAGIEKTSQIGYNLSTAKSYSTTSNVTTALGSSRIVFDNGSVVVFENNEVTATASPFTHPGGKTSSPLFNEIVTISYSTDPTGVGDNYQSSVAFTDGNLVIFKVESLTIENKAPRTYETLIQASVPPVLKNVAFTGIDLKNGGVEIIVDADIEEGYTGTFQGRITEYFTTEIVPPAQIPTTYKPRSVVYKGLNANFSIGATLHGPFTVTETIGPNDPIYEQGVYVKTFPGTEPMARLTGWHPYGRDVQPYKNGFIVRDIEILY